MPVSLTVIPFEYQSADIAILTVKKQLSTDYRQSICLKFFIGEC